MATYTSNYNIKKPDATEFARISDINDNMDIIDEELSKRASLDEHGKVPVSQIPDLEYDSGWISPEQYLGKRYRKIGNRVTVQFTTGSGVYLAGGGEVNALYQPLPVGFRPSGTFCFLGYSKNNNEMAVVFTVDSGGVVKAKRAPWETASQHQIQGCEFSFLI